jgi:nicotinamide riboside kinase
MIFVSLVVNELMSIFLYKRVVVGVTSSGKSTQAERLAKRFNLNYFELNALT